MCLGCKFKRQAALPVQALHGAQERAQRRQHRGAEPRGAHGGGGAGAGQVVVHLAARGCHLVLHQQRQRAVLLRSSIGQDRQRRVHRVRQVARLGAGALHHVGVLAQHVVELVDQRLQLLRKTALQLPGGAAAHGGQARAQQLQRAQRQLQFHRHRQRQNQRQQPQGDEQHVREALQRLGQQGGVARHHQPQQRCIVFGQLQGAGHGQQGVALCVLQGQHAVAAGGVGRGCVGQAQHLVPQ